MKPIEVGDQVIVPFEANEPWEEWQREGKVIIVSPPYCVVVVEVDPWHTERVTCKLENVKQINK